MQEVKQGDTATIIEWLKLHDPKQEWEIRTWSPKRSNKANAYYWVLVELITEERQKDDPQATTTETHRELMADYGSDKKDEKGQRIFHTFIYGKEPKEGYYSRPLADVTLKGKKDGKEKVEKGYICTEREGSHAYKAFQMKKLIDGAVMEAKNLEIETKPPAEIEQMIAEMERKDEKHHSE